MRWLALIPVVALAALAILFAGYALHHDPHVNPAAMVGRPVPAIQVARLDGGGDVDLRRLGQKPMLINFFASWCAPCVVEHPALMALKADGVSIVGVAYKDAPEKTQAFIAEHGDPFGLMLMDRSGRAGVEYGISGVPETFAVVGGRIVDKQTGPMTPEAADRLLRAIGAR
jgi:cytochrome c biogenesis protein CcmG/thiol:disulfide interchange protein DsbE